MKLTKSNILLLAMVNVLQGYSTVQKYKRKNFNLGNGHCVSVAQSGDKSEIINSFELRKVAGRLVAWAEQLDFNRCYFSNQGWLYFIQCRFPTKSSQKMVRYCFDLWTISIWTVLVRIS